MKQSQSEKAYEIAKRAHLGQVDKAGEDWGRLYKTSSKGG